MYIALHADEDVAYKEVVRVLDIANEHHMKLVVATKGKLKHRSLDMYDKKTRTTYNSYYRYSAFPDSGSSCCFGSYVLLR